MSEEAKSPFVVGETYERTAGALATVVAIVNGVVWAQTFEVVTAWPYDAITGKNHHGIIDLIPPEPPIVVSDEALTVWSDTPGLRESLAAAFPIIARDNGYERVRK